MQIFPNGYMYYAEQSGQGDLDEYGFPVAASSVEQSCRCTITTVTENRNAVYNGGAYVNATYSVTCNMEDVGDTFNPAFITLTHDNKGDLGRFQVLRLEYYTLTGTIEIWV